MQNLNSIKTELNLLIEGWGFEESQLFSPEAEFIQTPEGMKYGGGADKLSVIYTSNDKPYDIIKFDDATLQSKFVPGIENPTLYKQYGAERSTIEIITIFKTAYGHEFPIPAHKPHISTGKDKQTKYYKDVIDLATKDINSDSTGDYQFDLKNLSKGGGLSSAASDLTAIVKALNFLVSRTKKVNPDGTSFFSNEYSLFDTYERSKLQLGASRAYATLKNNITSHIKKEKYSKAVTDVINLLLRKWGEAPDRDTTNNFRADFNKIKRAVVELSKLYPALTYVGYNELLAKTIDPAANFMYSATYNVVKTLKKPITADDFDAYNNFILQSSKYCGYVDSLNTNDPSYFDYIVMLGSGSNFNKDFAERLKADHYNNAKIIHANKFTSAATTIDKDTLESHAEELAARAMARPDNRARIYVEKTDPATGEKKMVWVVDNKKGYQEFDDVESWIDAWSTNEMQKYNEMIKQGNQNTPAQIKMIPQDKRHSVNMFDFQNVGSDAKRVLIIDDNYVSGGSAVSAYRNIQKQVPGLEVKVLVPLRITNFAVGPQKQR
jgi:hypothetical protein